MTLKEIAEELKVSPSTVSRVLNGRSKNFSVKPELRRTKSSAAGGKGATHGK